MREVMYPSWLEVVGSGLGEVERSGGEGAGYLLEICL